MDEKRRDTIGRFALVVTLMATGFIAVLVKIGTTQWGSRHDQLLSIAQRSVSRNETILPNRGNIYDCNGNLLAGSAPAYYIRMDTRVPALHQKEGKLFYENIDSVSYALSAFFGDRSPKEYKELLSDGYKRGDGQLLLYPQRITHEQLKAVKKMPLFRLGQIKSGLLTKEYYQRIKPFGLLASRTVGSIYGDNGRGVSGLERAYETELKGRAGHKQVEMIDGRVIVSSNTEAEDGLDIISTIDTDLQDIVESQLLQTVSSQQADWGCCILMEVQTGEVKAIANLGLSNGEYIENKDYATTRIEPGSTFKTFSLMAVLDEGKFSLTDTLDLENGLWVYKDSKRPISDSHKHEKATVLQAFAASSNIGMAKMVTQTYEEKAERFIGKLDKMGARDSVIFQVPGTNQALINIPKDQETLSRMAFGYSVELPPIAILTFYNAIANDGKMIRPFLVKEIQKDGETVKTFRTSVVRSSICKSSTLHDVRTALEAVVWDDEYGTASVTPWGTKKAQGNMVHIAGKTGTARIHEKTGYNKNSHRYTFCGYFPMEDPQYTCICIVERPQVYTDAGIHCGGTVRRIAEKTIAHEGTISIKTRFVHPDSLLLPPIKRGKQSAIRKAAKGAELEVEYSSAEWAKVNELYKTEAIIIQENTVPNVIGMGAKDAVFAIERTGMQVRISGKGKVVSQSIAGGSAVIKGGIVKLDLK
ncbi:MAG TPA: hypothetical protein DIW30_02910 [Bacteroidales bacterium]|nr:hypothetical protein [Bacteroidales bacterium]